MLYYQAVWLHGWNCCIFLSFIHVSQPDKMSWNPACIMHVWKTLRNTRVVLWCVSAASSLCFWIIVSALFVGKISVLCVGNWCRKWRRVGERARGMTERPEAMLIRTPSFIPSHSCSRRVFALLPPFPLTIARGARSLLHSLAFFSLLPTPPLLAPFLLLSSSFLSCFLPPSSLLGSSLAMIPPFEPLRPQISLVPGGKRKRRQEGGGWVGEEGRKGGGGGEGDGDGSTASCEAGGRRNSRKHPGLQRRADRKEVKSLESELWRWSLLSHV